MIIEKSCKHCKCSFFVPKKAEKRKFCSRNCVNLYQVGPNNPSYQKTYRTKLTHPEWANKTSETHKIRQYIRGDKNPMKNIDVAKRMGATRSEKFKTDPNFRIQTSELVRAAWKNGKYDNVKVGKCNWFNYMKNNGVSCKLQGTWELAYAKWLDLNSIEFISHKGKIHYLDELSVSRSYYPDFYLPKTNEYIDIKNDYHYNLNVNKFLQIRSSNPDIKLTLLFKEDLIKLGIKL